MSENFAKIQAAKDEIKAAMDAGRNKVYEKYSKTLAELDKEQSDNQYRDEQGYLRDTPKSREAYKKWNATMDKRREEIFKYYESDEYKNLRKRRNALNYDLLGVVLKDIGYNDTPENRKLIEPLVFWD